MKIEYKSGDFLGGTELIVVHGCNAQGKMNSGAAKAVRQKYPEAYEAYMRMYAEQGLQVGSVCKAVVNYKHIVNLVTQDRYGYDGVQYVNYEKMRQAFIVLNAWVSLFGFAPGVKVAMPKIGSGLGGGDWEVISKIIEETSTFYQPVVYTL